MPYRDYLGSNLEILDVADRHATIVHQYRGAFQAPNWTHDGKALIYSGRGRRGGSTASISRRVTPTPINTGVCDPQQQRSRPVVRRPDAGHQPSAPEDSGRRSSTRCRRRRHAEARSRTKAPSYFHGWSPDGSWLVYTGGSEQRIRRLQDPGRRRGTEVRLTDAPGLDDGPEYTPDGTYIYFNSSRTGTMQIWRMRPDGSDQEQITNDGFNNWFPHISPDGQWIAYIAFRADVPANDHPFYKHVSLRLMPIAGGAAAGHRLSVWRSGNHQRSVVVARRQADRLREQYRRFEVAPPERSGATGPPRATAMGGPAGRSPRLTQKRRPTPKLIRLTGDAPWSVKMVVKR